MAFVGVEVGFHIVQLQAGKLDFSDFQVRLDVAGQLGEGVGKYFAVLLPHVVKIGGQVQFLQCDGGFQMRCVFMCVSEFRGNGLAVECAV